MKNLYPAAFLIATGMALVYEVRADSA